jgi:hypothetical protein
MNKKTNKKLCSTSIYWALGRNENEDWKVKRNEMNVKKLNEQGNDKCNTPNHDNEVSGTWGVMVVLLQDVAYL